MINESALKAMFNQSLKLKSNDKCLIVTDTVLEDLAKEFFNYATTISGDCLFHVIEPTGESGREPPVETADLMLGYDVILLVTKFSLSHTKARRDAVDNGARLVSMPGITEGIINRCIDIDYDALFELNQKLRKKIILSEKVRITSALGTDVTLSVTNTHGEHGGYRDKPGMWGNLPAGEVDSGVVEGSTNGVIVVDGSFPGMGLLDETPLTIKIENGFARSITGKRADELIEKLETVGKNAYKIAELGIGTNPNARVTGVVLEDEKVLGTVHMALGNDLTYGGKNDVPLHLDGVIRNPTIFVYGGENSSDPVGDEEKIMDEGKFLI